MSDIQLTDHFTDYEFKRQEFITSSPYLELTNRRFTLTRVKDNTLNKVTYHFVVVHSCLLWREIWRYDDIPESEFYRLLNVYGRSGVDSDFGYYPSSDYDPFTTWHYDFWFERH